MTENPAHAITVTPEARHVTVLFAGMVVAKSDRPLVLREGRLPPVLYIPREDVRMDLLQRSDHRTHCPFKGDATYYGITVDARESRNAAWSYESPKPAVEAIRGHLAFYPDRVAAIEGA